MLSASSSAGLCMTQWWLKETWDTCWRHSFIPNWCLGVVVVDIHMPEKRPSSKLKSNSPQSEGWEKKLYTVASDLQKGSEMQQRQREAFLAKLRNWAGKPLGQNFALEGEGKKKKKKKKKKVAEGHFFFLFLFLLLPPCGYLKKIFRTACSCPWSYHPPLQRRGLQRPKSEIRTLRVPFFSRDRAVRLFSCFLCYGHWVQVHTVTAYPSYSDWDK